jgi:uncharacterized protein (TIGR03437 family)
MATLSGANLTAQAAVTAAANALPTTLGGIEVLANGRPMPLLFASGSRVNFLCPHLPARTELEIMVQTEDGSRLFAAPSVMVDAAPGLFEVDGPDQGAVLIQGTNQLAKGADQGAQGQAIHAGDTLTIYATGLGETETGWAGAGWAPTDREVRLAGNKVRVRIGDAVIDPTFAGLAPGTAGIYQVDATVPKDAPTAASVPLQLEVVAPDGTVLVSNRINFVIEPPKAAAIATR